MVKKAKSKGRGPAGPAGPMLSAEVLEAVHNDPRALEGALVEKAAAGRREEVEKLLAVGVAPDARDAAGEPALCAAAVAGHARVVEALLDAGGDVLAATTFQETALHLAARAGFGDVARRVLDAAQRTNRAHALLKQENYMGATALHVAAEKGHADLCAALLEAGAEIQSLDHSGRSPLHLATYWSNRDVVRALLKYGADPDHAGTAGESAFQAARGSGNVDIELVLYAHVAERLERKSRGLEADLVLATQARVAAQQNEANMKKQFGAMQLEHEQMQQAVGAAERALAALQGQLAQALDKADAADGRRQVAESKLVLVQDELQRQKARLDFSEASVAKEGRNADAARTAATEAVREQVAERERAAEAKQRADGLGAENAELRAKLAAVGGKLDDFQAATDRIRREHGRMSKDLEDKEVELGCLRSELAAHKSHAASASAALARLTASVDQNRGGILALMQEHQARLAAHLDGMRAGPGPSPAKGAGKPAAAEPLRLSAEHNFQNAAQR